VTIHLSHLLGRKPPVIHATDSEDGEFPNEDQPQINPGAVCPRDMQDIGGLTFANPNIGGSAGMAASTYARDIDSSPITFNRFGTRWGDVQLKNGLANGVASGKIYGYRGEGWYDVVVPTIPGQTRVFGRRPAGFVPRGGAPSQWQNAYNATAGSQPQYPAGPGSVLSNSLVSPMEALAGGG
jgi:hypothetical protein